MAAVRGSRSASSGGRGPLSGAKWAMHVFSLPAHDYPLAPAAMLRLVPYLLLISLLGGCAVSQQPVPTPVSTETMDPEREPERQPPPAPVVEAPLRILVHKGSRTLALYTGDRLLKSYPVALGKHPSGPKRKEGDGRTPEGEYYVSVKNPDSRFYLSLGLSYPNRLDAENAFLDGRITREEFRRISRAIDHGTSPPWNTVLGGAIFIHGFGAHRDWTEGCIALWDGDIRELFALVDVGTPVIITP